MDKFFIMVMKILNTFYKILNHADEKKFPPHFKFCKLSPKY